MIHKGGQTYGTEKKDLLAEILDVDPEDIVDERN